MKTAPHVGPHHAGKVFYHSALIEIKCMSKRQLVGATNPLEEKILTPAKTLPT